MPDAPPPYQPGSAVGDLAALRRAEHYALMAESNMSTALAARREATNPNRSVSELVVQGHLAMASTAAQLARTWAFIAVVYQGPGDDDRPVTERLGQSYDEFVGGGG